MLRFSVVMSFVEVQLLHFNVILNWSLSRLLGIQDDDGYLESRD